LPPTLVLGAWFQAIFLLELLHPTGGIDEFLLAGIEGVALGANLDPNLWTRRTRVDYLAAGADDRTIDVLRMDLSFHAMLLSKRQSCDERLGDREILLNTHQQTTTPTLCVH
jgi:hypothetical protein